jgi:RNA polymerase sigma-54 factor
MSSNYSQSQSQSNKQGYYLSMQHMQFMQLLHLSGQALDEYLQNQLEENPMLEIADKNPEDNEITDNETFAEEFFDEAYKDEYKYEEKASYNSKTEDQYIAPVMHHDTFYDKLKTQIIWMPISEDLKKLAYYIVDALDEDGYLKRDDESISYDYSFSTGNYVDKEDVAKAIKILQQCEPIGIGARDLRECLLIQLSAKKGNSLGLRNAKKILEEYYTKLSGQNLQAIQNSLQITGDQLADALQIIQSLSPTPNVEHDKYETYRNQITPSIEVTFDGHDFSVNIVNSKFGNLAVSQTIEEFTKRDFANAKIDKLEKKYWIKMASDAQCLVEAIKQREKTMMSVISAILKLQLDFFKYGDKRFLQPMILEQVAKLSACDISTVSRITSNKYVQTSFGCFLLKELFSSSLHTEEGQISSHKVKELIEEMVKSENKKNPLTDNQIVHELKSAGISIARRTIVKYRELLGIPSYSLRIQSVNA